MLQLRWNFALQAPGKSNGRLDFLKRKKTESFFPPNFSVYNILNNRKRAGATRAKLFFAHYKKECAALAKFFFFCLLDLLLLFFHPSRCLHLIFSITRLYIFFKETMSAYHLYGKTGNSGENSNRTVHSGGNFPEKYYTFRGFDRFPFLPKFSLAVSLALILNSYWCRTFIFP